MRIEENIGTTSVRREYRHDEEGKKQYRLWRGVYARRNIGIARIRGEDKEDKFLCVTYDGPDALKVSSIHTPALMSLTSCSDRHSNKTLTSLHTSSMSNAPARTSSLPTILRNANVAQIFGYNDNERGLPALVFYDGVLSFLKMHPWYSHVFSTALIPLGRIVIDGNRLSPLLYSYFAQQVRP